MSSFTRRGKKSGHDSLARAMVLLNNALAELTEKDDAAKLRRLRAYAVEFLRPLREHVGERLISPHDAAAILVACAMAVVLEADPFILRKRGLSGVVMSIFGGAYGEDAAR